MLELHVMMCGSKNGHKKTRVSKNLKYVLKTC